MLNTLNYGMNPWRLLDDFLRDDWADYRGPGAWGRAGGFRYPRVNVWEADDAMVVDAELPGVNSKDVDIAVEKAELTLGGTLPNGEDEARRFERRFELPFAIDADRVEAVYRAGMLRITLPKAEEAKRRRIVVHS